MTYLDQHGSGQVGDGNVELLVPRWVQVLEDGAASVQLLGAEFELHIGVAGA